MLRNKQQRIGSLGAISFMKGYYTYVGSARQGLRNRVARHLIKDKNKRWHLDWLSSLPTVKIPVVASTSRRGIECSLASALREEADRYVLGFGSTDCGCLSHLCYFTNYGELTGLLTDLNLRLHTAN